MLSSEWLKRSIACGREDLFGQEQVLRLADLDVPGVSHDPSRLDSAESCETGGNANSGEADGPGKRKAEPPSKEQECVSVR